MSIADSRRLEMDTNDMPQNYAGRTRMTSVAVREMADAIQADQTLSNRIHDAQKKNGGLAPAV
ncbi:hypothetical protein [Pinirhizobacter sp.]|jgi:hypothetical protein|uniref:hypothetical protein n=1 Tax=Pinirhizobacter sp. TaxID=2950432 RepID=UPI002F3E66AE